MITRKKTLSLPLPGRKGPAAAPNKPLTDGEGGKKRKAPKAFLELLEIEPTRSPTYALQKERRRTPLLDGPRLRGGGSKVLSPVRVRIILFNPFRKENASAQKRTCVYEKEGEGGTRSGDPVHELDCRENFLPLFLEGKSRCGAKLTRMEEERRREKARGAAGGTTSRWLGSRGRTKWALDPHVRGRKREKKGGRRGGRAALAPRSTRRDSSPPTPRGKRGTARDMETSRSVVKENGSS